VKIVSRLLNVFNSRYGLDLKSKFSYQAKTATDPSCAINGASVISDTCASHSWHGNGISS
jgi:hypothetical protein